MNEADADSMAEMPDSHPEGCARNAREQGRSASSVTADQRTTSPKHRPGLIDQTVEGSNMRRAYQRVMSNGGAPCVDSVATGELKAWLHEHWAQIKVKLQDGSYRPDPVRIVEIPNPGEANGCWVFPR